MQPPFVIRRPVASTDGVRIASEPPFTITSPAGAVVLDLQRRLWQLERWLALAADHVRQTGN